MNDSQEACKVLQAFFGAMNAWEKDAKSLYKRAEKGEFDGEEWARRIIASLELVYRDYCETDKPPARLERGNIRYCSPPEYNADGEKILEVDVENEIATITTIRTHDPQQMKLVYQLVRSRQGWRIRDNRRELRKDKRLVPWDL